MMEKEPFTRPSFALTCITHLFKASSISASFSHLFRLQSTLPSLRATDVMFSSSFSSLHEIGCEILRSATAALLVVSLEVNDDRLPKLVFSLSRLNLAASRSIRRTHDRKNETARISARNKINIHNRTVNAYRNTVRRKTIEEN